MSFSALSSLSAGKHPTPPLSIRLRHTSFFLIWEGGRHIATFKSALCSESSPSAEIHDLSQLFQVFISITFSVKSSLSTLWKCAFLPSILHTSLSFYFSLSFSHHLAYFIYLIYSFFFFPHRKCKFFKSRGFYLFYHLQIPKLSKMPGILHIANDYKLNEFMSNERFSAIFSFLYL